MDPPVAKEEGYLQLSLDPIRFEPVSKVTNVFFDETNKEVLSVRAGGTLGVVVKGRGRTLTFCMEHTGVISSIKFSPDHSILAIQRTNTSVELLRYNDGELNSGLTQECRAKNAKLLGFIWTNDEDFVLVNDHAVEFYQVVKEKMTSRFLRSYSLSCKWFLWSPECNLLLLCLTMAVTSATLQPFAFAPGQVTKYPKFEVEISGGVGAQQGGGGSVILCERDICIGVVYSLTSICVLRHPATPSLPAHLDIYSQNKDGSFKRIYICKLEMTGKFAVNIIDSLIVVHHQTSKTSLLFDVLIGEEVSNGVTSIYPVTLPKSVRPFSLEEGAVSSTGLSSNSIPCQLYASTWVVFQPDIIIDARLGCMWTLQLCLDALPPLMEEKTQLIDCLLRRKSGKALVLSVTRLVIENGNFIPLGQIFDKINAYYLEHLNHVLQSQIGDCVSGGLPPPLRSTTCVVVDQAEMYSNIFAPLMEIADKALDRKLDETDDATSASDGDGVISTRLMVGVILEYVRSLDSCSITVQHFLYELVINGLVRIKQFYQLHQLLQYHVLADSKPLACLLLSLVGVYAAGEQLSLDMLYRLNTAHDEITEVLLSHKLVTQALRYAKSVGLVESISARKFLEAAMNSDDPLIFFSTFKFFALRNAGLRGNSAFAKGEHCDVYVDHYKKLFGDPPEYSSQSS